MAWNGSGVFARLYSWIADRDAGIDITASRMDSDTDDIVAGLMLCLTRDGQTLPLANLAMNGFRHTGASDAGSPGDYVTLRQIQGGAVAINAGSASLSGTLTVAGPTTLAALTANSIVTGTLNATGVIATAGSNASLAFEERDAPGQEWALYANTQRARLWYSGAGDVVTVTRGGNLATLGGIFAGDDIVLGRTTLANSYLLRPNITGYKNMDFAVQGGGPLDNFTINSGNTWITGALNVAGAAGLGALGIAGNLTVGGSLTVNNTVISTGPLAAYQFEDRTSAGTQWTWYAYGGAARLYYFGDLVGIDTGGNLAVYGGVYGSAFHTRHEVWFGDRATAAADQWAWYAESGVMRLWAGVDRVTVDGAGDLSVTGNLTAAFSVNVGGDLVLTRTSQPYGYVLRPNVAGYKNLQFAVVGSGPLDNVFVNSAYTNIAGNMQVNGTLLALQPIFSYGAAAGLYFEDRANPGSGWLWYATGAVARLHNDADRLTVDSVGNLVAGNNISANGASVGIMATSQAYGYVLRPNISGYKNLAFAVTAGGPLDSCVIVSNSTNTTGNLTVGGTTTLQGTLTLNGGLSIPGNLTVAAGVSAASFSALGSTAMVAFEDRAAPGSSWGWYATGGTARLYNGADRLTVDSVGNLVTGNISANGVQVEILGTSQAYGFLLRPNTAGYRNLGFAVTAGGPLDDFYVNSAQLHFTGNLTVNGATTLAALTVDNTMGGGDATINRSLVVGYSAFSMGTGTVNVTGGYYISGAPHLAMSAGFAAALAARAQGDMLLLEIAPEGLVVHPVLAAGADAQGRRRLYIQETT